MTIMHVQFSDATQTKIITAFGGPQDPEFWPNLGEVEDTDPRYIAFIDPSSVPPTPEQILQMNQAAQEVLKIQASQAMTPLLMALQLDADDEITAKAREWRDYYQELGAVDLTVAEPAWPEIPA